MRPANRQESMSGRDPQSAAPRWGIVGAGRPRQAMALSMPAATASTEPIPKARLRLVGVVGPFAHGPPLVGVVAGLVGLEVRTAAREVRDPGGGVAFVFADQPVPLQRQVPDLVLGPQPAELVQLQA